jgi:hypothetical protein
MVSLNELPAGSNVLMLWEPRGFYCPVKCQADEILDRWQLEYTRFDTPDEILGTWQRLGFTHVLVNKFGMQFIRANDPRYTDQSWELLDDLLGQMDLRKNLDDTYLIYRLIP